MGTHLYLKDFYKCKVCKNKLGVKKKFLCGKKCFKNYRKVYMKYLMRGLSGRQAKIKALREYE